MKTKLVFLLCSHVIAINTFTHDRNSRGARVQNFIRRYPGYLLSGGMLFTAAMLYLSSIKTNIILFHILKINYKDDTDKDILGLMYENLDKQVKGDSKNPFYELFQHGNNKNKPTEETIRSIVQAKKKEIRNWLFNISWEQEKKGPDIDNISVLLYNALAIRINNLIGVDNYGCEISSSNHLSEEEIITMIKYKKYGIFQSKK